MKNIEKLKTALITPFDTGNIGTVAQAYATQALISGLGYENKLIYFHYDAIQNPFLLSNLTKRGLKRYLGSIAGYLLRFPSKKGLWRFINRHIELTDKVNADELANLSEEFDFIIVGSDCVWNGDTFDLETAYLLDFVKETYKKGNFASSFSCEVIADEQKEVFKKYLSQFAMLSVREKRGKEIIKDLTGKDATVVLDPTLTCDSAFWKRIVDESKLNIRCEYIFCAEYAISRPMIEDAVILSQKYDIPVYCLYPPKGKKIFAKVFLKAAPEDVLYLICHARYILTDSYHMMIFSINFNKEFFAYRTGTNIATISKYNSILEYLNLEERLFHTENVKQNTVNILSKQPIDYTEINIKLSRERKKSLEYLTNLLQYGEKAKTYKFTGGGYETNVLYAASAFCKGGLVA